MQEIKLKVGSLIRFKQDNFCGYKFGTNLAYKTLGQVTGEDGNCYIINILNNSKFSKDVFYNYKLKFLGYSFPKEKFNLNVIEIIPNYSNAILHLMFPNI